MVNPAFYPEQRRGPSGPIATPGGGGSSFEPFDNEIYFDPDYVNSGETGSIGAPYLTWDDWAAAIGDNAWRVMFPGVEVTGGEIPLTDGNAIVIEGVKASVTAGTHIAGTTQILNPATDGASIEFRNLSIELLENNGGDYDIIFTRCIIDDLIEGGGDFTGTLYGYDSSFGVLTNFPTATARIRGGNVRSLTAHNIYLNDLVVGEFEISAGTITSHSDGEEPAGTIYCENVTFEPGSTIEFDSAGEGDLYLDGPSYKSFLDNDIALTNGRVIRNDGNWPQDAIAYASVAGAAEEINFAKNPRAILEYDTTFTLTFVAPLTREVQILLINTGTGGPFDFPANVFFSDGIPPDFPTDVGAETLLRLDYEVNTDTYYCWVALMSAEAAP